MTKHHRHHKAHEKKKKLLREYKKARHAALKRVKKALPGPSTLSKLRVEHALKRARKLKIK